MADNEQIIIILCFMEKKVRTIHCNTCTFRFFVYKNVVFSRFSDFIDLNAFQF